MREYYPILGAVLLKTLESFLGTDWTPEVKQAWIDGYEAIANLMLEGDPENSIGGDA
jgi:hemoglobin-like flavoprotein